METMEIAAYRNEPQGLPTMLSPQTVCKLADGRAIKQVSDVAYEVTTYKGQPATKKEIADETAQLLIIYPKMTDAFMAILMQEIVEDCWPVERVRDAVKNLKRRQLYPTFTIADFMAFDKPFKLYNYSGYLWLINSGRAKDNPDPNKSDFGMIKQDGCVFWYLKKDVPQKKIKKIAF